MAKKRKNIGLPILAGTLILLAGSYVCLLEYQKVQETEQEIQESLDAEKARIYMNQMENINSIQYVNGENEISFSKEEGQWIITELPDFPLSQSYPEEIELLLQSLEATRKFETPDALEDYGLDQPEITVTASDEEGNTITIYIGDAYDSEYYAYTSQEPLVVYTMDASIVRATELGLYDMIELEESPILTETNILTVEMTVPEGTFLAEKVVEIIEGEEETIEESSETDNSEDETVTTEEVTKWYVSKNGEEPQELSEDGINELISMIGSIEPQGCVNYKADDIQLEDYGITEDAVTINVTYESEEEKASITWYVGNLDAENAMYYVRTEGSRAVNLVAEDVLSEFMSGNLAFMAE